MRIKIKVTLKNGEATFMVHPAIYDIFKWHWEHKKDFKIGNRVMKHDEILAIEPVGIELEQQGTFVVVFENGAFRPNKGNDITLHEMLEDCDWAKVVGNIYEKPELVEV